MPPLSPLAYACIGLVLAWFVTLGVEEYRIESWKADLAAAIADNARLQAQAHDLEAANQDWEAKSAMQSAAVQTLAKLAQDNAAQGQKRVAAVLARPVTIPEGHGPQVLNAWYGQP